MARSVSYPTSAIVAFTSIEFTEQEDSASEFDWFCDTLCDRAATAFPSLDGCNGWRGREDRILMRNRYADFGVSEYCGLVAVWIAEREDGAYLDAAWRNNRSGRAQHWLRQIEARFLAEFGDYECLGHMSNGEGVYRKRAA